MHLGAAFDSLGETTHVLAISISYWNWIDLDEDQTRAWRASDPHWTHVRVGRRSRGLRGRDVGRRSRGKI